MTDRPLELVILDPREPMRDFLTHLERSGPWRVRALPDLESLRLARFRSRPRLVLLSTWRLEGVPRAIMGDVHRHLGEVPVVVLLEGGAADPWLEAGARAVVAAPTRLRELQRVLEPIAAEVCPGAFAGRPPPAGGSLRD